VNRGSQTAPNKTYTVSSKTWWGVVGNRPSGVVGGQMEPSVTSNISEDISMNLQEIVQQYRGTTLKKLIEHQIKSMNEGVLLQAIKGTYEHFPIEFCPQVDTFTLTYPRKKWSDSDIFHTADLGDIFSETIRDIKAMSAQAGVPLDDEHVFDMFNLIVMRISYFAHSHPDFRKKLGIKKGWFT